MRVIVQRVREAAVTVDGRITGSGEVKRDPRNRALATFANGKQYNADFSAS